MLHCSVVCGSEGEEVRGQSTRTRVPGSQEMGPFPPRLASGDLGLLDFGSLLTYSCLSLLCLTLSNG